MNNSKIIKYRNRHKKETEKGGVICIRDLSDKIENYMSLKVGKELQVDTVIKAFLFLDSWINERCCSNSFIKTKT